MKLHIAVVMLMIGGCVSNRTYNRDIKIERKDAWNRGFDFGLTASDGDLYRKINECQNRLMELILTDSKNLEKINFERALEDAAKKTNKDFCLMGYKIFCDKGDK